MFYQCSGLALNSTKTEVMQVGVHRWKLKGYKINEAKERVYSLGTWFYKDPQLSVTENTKIKLEAFRNELNKWQLYNLTLFGKITVLKSLALSKLNYLITSIETTGEFINEVQELIHQFLWNKKVPKVKNSTAYLKHEDGGLSLHILNLM